MEINSKKLCSFNVQMLMYRPIAGGCSVVMRIKQATKRYHDIHVHEGLEHAWFVVEYNESLIEYNWNSEYKHKSKFMDTVAKEPRYNRTACRTKTATKKKYNINNHKMISIAKFRVRTCVLTHFIPEYSIKRYLKL